MDNSLVRRGVSTVHHHLRGRLATSPNSSPGRLANSYATVLSDCVHAKAAHLMAQPCCSEALDEFYQVSLAAAKYQFHDLVGWRGCDNVDKIADVAERMVTLSTELRFVHPLKVGSAFTEAPLPPAALAWAGHFGRAFKVSVNFDIFD